MIYETIIIGAGIGGISAGIYAARQRMNYLIIAKDIGGQMYESGEVLNYPGIVKTDGAKFLLTLEKQIEFNELQVKNETVQSVRRLGNGIFNVKTDSANYQTRTIIIASGSVPKRLDVPGEKRLAKKGVTYCAICDGPLFSNKDVAVIGGGDSALEAADFMSRIAKTVYLITINPELQGHTYLVERAKGLKNLNIIKNAVTTEILGDDFVSGIAYEHNGNVRQLRVQAVMIEIGRVPKTDFVTGTVDSDAHGHILVDRWARCFFHGKPMDDIYAIGDCTDIHDYQYVISAGMGVTALLEAARYLTKTKR